MKCFETFTVLQYFTLSTILYETGFACVFKSLETTVGNMLSDRLPVPGGPYKMTPLGGLIPISS